VSVLASSPLSLGQREDWEFVSANVGRNLIDSDTVYVRLTCTRGITDAVDDSP